MIDLSVSDFLLPSIIELAASKSFLAINISDSLKIETLDLASFLRIDSLKYSIFLFTSLVSSAL